MESAGAKILEPVMKVEVSGPEEYAPLPPWRRCRLCAPRDA